MQSNKLSNKNPNYVHLSVDNNIELLAKFYPILMKSSFCTIKIDRFRSF